MARLDRLNRTKFWCDRRVPGLSLMRADFRSHDYGQHTHDAFVIAATETGGARIKTRHAVEAAFSRTLFVSNPEEPQSSWMGDSACWSYRSIYLARPAIDAIARALGIETVPFFTRSVIEDSDLIGRFVRLHAILEEDGDEQRSHEMIVDVLGTLFCRHGSHGIAAPPVPRDQALVRKIVEIMRAGYGERLCLASVAAGVGLTQFQMIGLFRRALGMTPHAFLNGVRLNTACYHLRRGVPLAEAAVEAGFYDQSALTKHFKRCYGITPLQFALATRSYSFTPSERALKT